MFIRRIIYTVAAVVGGLVFLASPAKAAAPGDVVISELLWMGSSKSAADEWIELRNMTAAPVDISSWTLFKKSSGASVLMLTIPAGKSIAAGGFFLIANYAETDSNSSLAVTPDVVATAVSLVNSDLQITLVDAGGATIDVADDGQGTPLSGKYVSGKTWLSMERNFVPADGQQKESWHTASAAVNLQSGAELGTPRAANSNLPPTLPALSDRETSVGEVVPFDVSESFDPDGDPLSFSWDFGDASTATGTTPVHAFAAASSYAVKVTASDGQATATATASVVVHAAASVPTSPKPTTSKSPPAAAVPAAPLPSPPAAARQESPSASTTETVPGILPDNPVIPGLRISELLVDPVGSDAEGEFVELRDVGRQTLSTAGWQLRVATHAVSLPSQRLAPNAFLVVTGPALKLRLVNQGQTVYLIDPKGKIRQGVRYPKAKTGKAFALVSKRWVWTEPTPGEENVVPENTDNDEPAAKVKEYLTLTVADARQASANMLLTLQGVVAVPPGVDAERRFILADQTGSIAVTLSTDQALSVGNRISVAGRKSTAREPAVRADASQVTVLPGQEAVAPTPMTIGDLSDDELGTYVRLSGLVSASRSGGFTLDDETGALSVSGVQQKVAKDDQVTVDGVVHQTSGRYRLRAFQVTVAERPGQVASATVTANPPQPVPRSAAQQRVTAPKITYLLVGLAGLLMLLRQVVLSR